MRYYFFKTENVDRGNGNGPENTLLALPGQTFPDGKPVDTTFCVHAPKEAGSSKNGNRLDYALGTVFCSTTLFEMTSSRGKKFYTVYDESKGQDKGKNDPDFFPVSLDPNFSYAYPQHRNDRMNAAYVNFTQFQDQTDGAEEEAEKASKATAPAAMRHTPYDAKGNARGPIAGWTPFYEDQVETESNLIVSWVRRMLADMGIRTPMKRPKLDDDAKSAIGKLYACGETVDTICSRVRFNAIATEERMGQTDLSSIGKGPLQWYLDVLVSEHDGAKPCTSVPRSADDPVAVKDAVFIANSEINNQLATTENGDDPVVLGDMKKAIEAGWTLDDIMVPEVLLSTGGIGALTKALASGAIPLPERAKDDPSNNFILNLLKNPKYAKPEDKDGFHVDNKTWKLLLRNVFRRKNTLLLGPTGSGKTQLVQRLCQQLGLPLTIIPMGTITDPSEQLVGKMDLDPATNGTKFDWADFALAIQRPGVVLLDEINRIPRNGENMLFSVLDGTRTLVASSAKSTDKRTIQVNPECVFFATANMGAAYTGTKELDLALGNRFMYMELDYLDPKTESVILQSVTKISKEDANNIALVAKNIRQSCRQSILQHAVSTRETIECASLVADGFDVEEALELAFLPLFEAGVTENDSTSERGKVRAMIAGRFNGS